MMQPGLKAEKRITVRQEDTAEMVGSGTLPVLATPRMIALIEATASAAVAPELEPGTSTVGTLVNVSHTSATPIGMEVVCTAELVEVDRRRLVFKVEVSDASGPIGSGAHERFVVNDEKFMSKAESKLGA
jgi:predicted thioesterase